MNYHGYHLVSSSPWPLYGSVGGFGFLLGLVWWMHGFNNGLDLWKWGGVLMLLSVVLWFSDVVSEGLYIGEHVGLVGKGLMYGFIIFIGSELMLFFGVFWAYLHSALSPVVWVGGVWPPVGIMSIGPMGLAFWNTGLLLSSGVFVTWAHHSIMGGSSKDVIVGLGVTIWLGGLFSFYQGWEYMNVYFSISDSIYGSVFYMGTGLHGLHVLVGSVFLLVGLISFWNYEFGEKGGNGMEASIIYWHFVDVIWLVLYVLFYVWGS